MLNKLPSKKEYLLPAGIILMLLVCYQFAFKKTIAAWQLNRQLNRQLTTAADPAIQPAYLLRKSANISKVLNLYRSDTATFRSNAINQIAEIAQKEHVKLSAVPLSDPVYHTDQFIIQKLQFEGSFFALDRVLNDMNALPGAGRVRCADFRVAKVNGTNPDLRELDLDLYIELLKQD